jgi:hypothetical protein
MDGKREKEMQYKFSAITWYTILLVVLFDVTDGVLFVVTDGVLFVVTDGVFVAHFSWYIAVQQFDSHLYQTVSDRSLQLSLQHWSQ